MPDQFVDAADLAVFLNMTFDSGLTAQAEALLQGATTAIQAEAGQHILLVDDDTVLLAGTWGYDLELPEWPVVSVDAVLVNGAPLTPPGAFEWNNRQLLRRSLALSELTGAGLWNQAPGARFNNAGHWGGPSSTVEVTYTHGYATPPDDLVLICKQAAARVILNPSGIQSESLGAYGVRYVAREAGGVSVLLDDDERRIIRSRYRH